MQGHNADPGSAVGGTRLAAGAGESRLVPAQRSDAAWVRKRRVRGPVRVRKQPARAHGPAGRRSSDVPPDRLQAAPRAAEDLKGPARSPRRPARVVTEPTTHPPV